MFQKKLHSQDTVMVVVLSFLEIQKIIGTMRLHLEGYFSKVPSIFREFW